MILFLFITTQITLSLFMALHDWVEIPPFTHAKALREQHSWQLILFSTLINTLPVLWALYLTCSYYPGPYPSWVTISFVIIYTMITIGTICSWWIPYILGSSEKHKQGFIEYKHTHAFLPPRGDNVIPNTLHVLLHLQVWICCVISWYLLVNN